MALDGKTVDRFRDKTTGNNYDPPHLGRGVGTGFDYDGSFGAFFQDGTDKELVDQFGSVTMWGRYAGWTDATATPPLNTIDPDFVPFKSFSLQAANIYTEKTILNYASKNGLTNRTFPYGIVPAGAGTDGGDVWLKISETWDTSTTSRTFTSDKWIKVPFKEYYYVRNAELVDGFKWVNPDNEDPILKEPRDYWFVDEPSHALKTVTGANTKTDAEKAAIKTYWVDKVLIPGKIQLEVSYNGTDTKNTRDAGHLYRAYQLGYASLTNVPDFTQLDLEGERAVFLQLEYYPSRDFGWNINTGGEYPNPVEGLYVPLAVFKEEVEFRRKPLTANDKPIQLVRGKGDDDTTEAQNALLDSWFLTLKESYDLYGLYDFGGKTVYREVPPNLWAQNWFNFSEVSRYDEKVIADTPQGR